MNQHRLSLSLTGMPAFTAVWVGQLVSLIGSSMTRFAIAIWLFQETSLATTFTTMIFFEQIPRIALSPLAGALSDRWNRKMVMMVSDLTAGLTSIIIYFLLSGDMLQYWHLFVLVAFSSAFESFQFPAYSSAITMMVDKKHFARTSAMLALARDASRVIAPLLAAALIFIIKVEGILLIDIITFVFAIGVLVLIPIPQPKQSETGKKASGGLLKETVYGFRFIKENPGLLGLQFNFFMVNFISGMSTILMTPMILARTGSDANILGTVASIGAAGAVVGGLIMTAWGGPKRKIHGVLIGLVLLHIGLGIQGLGREVIVWSVGGFLRTLFMPLSNASLQAIWQSKTPADVQGRVFAARRLIAQISYPIAILISGPLSDRLLEPAMATDGSLAPIFGGLIGTGPGTGMSLVIFSVAVVGFFLPFLGGYAISAVRNVEDMMPDIEIAVAPEDTEAVRTDGEEQKVKAAYQRTG